MFTKTYEHNKKMEKNVKKLRERKKRRKKSNAV